MKIPYSQLSPESLRGIIEEYVSREGTEYGSKDYTLDEKVEQVLVQIRRGEVVIEFDPDSQSCHLHSVMNIFIK
ncbi:MAG: YheU family protein [Gammaproteobacteria bacterium]|nr:YheU family protein [Gammaproteobacteria bacterium]